MLGNQSCLYQVLACFIISLVMMMIEVDQHHPTLIEPVSSLYHSIPPPVPLEASTRSHDPVF